MHKPFLAVAFATLATTAQAETCNGEILTGTLDAGVGECGFLSKSAVAHKIFAVCKMGDICEVVAKVRGDDKWIDSVQSVKLIKKAE